MIDRNAIASLIVLSGLLAGTYAAARPVRNVHSVSEYAGITRTVDVAPSEDGAVMQPGTMRPVRHVVVAKGTAKVWTCGAAQESAIGGSYRACEWEVVK